jgi:hypothetical protein
MDPVIDEMLRARHPIRPDVFKRWCAHLRDVVQPQLDELDSLKADPPAVDDKPKKGRAA